MTHNIIIKKTNFNQGIWNSGKKIEDCDKFWLFLFKPLSFFDINHLLFSSEELKY